MFNLKNKLVFEMKWNNGSKYFFQNKIKEYLNIFNVMFLSRSSEFYHMVALSENIKLMR